MKLPKLHLRDLFWLVLVCALAVGWWRERSHNREVNASTINSLIRDLETEPEMQGVFGVVVSAKGEKFMVEMTRANGSVRKP
jgi:hypothetical protein